MFSAQLTKAYQTANVLFEVLKAVNMTQSIEVDREVKLRIIVYWHFVGSYENLIGCFSPSWDNLKFIGIEANLELVGQRFSYTLSLYLHFSHHLPVSPAADIIEILFFICLIDSGSSRQSCTENTDLSPLQYSSSWSW